MNKSIFIATVGNRDLLYNGQQITPPRIEGEKLIEKLKNESELFDIPIILPALKHALRSSSVATIILLVTDQSEHVNQEDRDKDTIYFGNIIQTLLHNRKKEYGLDSDVKIKVTRITENPTFIAGLLNSLQPTFSQTLLKIRSNEAIKAFLCITGGIPSANFAVLMIAYRVFKNNLELLRVNDGVVSPDRINVEFEKAEIDSKILSLVSKQNFRSVQLLLEEYGKASSPYRQIHALCKAICERLVFDFEGSFQTLSLELGSAEKFSQVYAKMIDELKPVANVKEPYEACRSLMIRELLLNIHFKFIQKEYVDVLGRLFRVLEELSLIVLEKATGLTFKFSENDASYPEFGKYVSSNQDLEKVFREKKLDATKLNILTAETALNVLKNRPDMAEAELINNFLGLYAKLYRLKQLRNKTITAHGFKSVKESDFPADFLDLIREAGRMVDVADFEKSIELAINAIEQHCV